MENKNEEVASVELRFALSMPSTCRTIEDAATCPKCVALDAYYSHRREERELNAQA